MFKFKNSSNLKDVQIWTIFSLEQNSKSEQQKTVQI
jgi:hypothetical protein